MSKVCISVMLGSAALLLSCGPYSFSGSTVTEYKNIFIPVFENETVEYGLGEALTTRVTEAFVSDHSLKIVPRERADAILEGKLTSYKRSSYTYTEQDQVQEYKVDITAAVRFVKPSGDLIWEDRGVTSFGLFEADQETEEDGRNEALDKLAEAIVNRTVRDW